MRSTRNATSFDVDTLQAAAVNRDGNALPQAKDPSTGGTGAHVERVCYKVSQAAQATGISRYVLYDAIRSGELRAYQPTASGHLVITVEDLRAWVTRRPAPSQAVAQEGVNSSSARDARQLSKHARSSDG